MRSKPSNRELIFQVILHLVVFAFYAFERYEAIFQIYKVAFFLDYALAAAILNFIGLPLFYKNRKLWQFIGIGLLAISVAVVVEEVFLEPIFFDGPRAETYKFLLGYVQIIPVIAILTGAKFGWDALHKQKEVDLLKDSVRQSELQYLKSQINPHFLFNNLNNLYAYALEGSEKTPEIILELSGLLRYMLYECQDEYVSLRKEVDHLENFIGLNELQIEERGEVHFTHSGSFGSYKVAPLILVVFVENAFKHSSGSQSEDIKIDISVSIGPNGLLHFSCVNNYQDVSNNDKLAKGIGLENAKKRLEMMYPKAHKLTIQNQKNQYIVDLTIDLNN